MNYWSLCNRLVRNFFFFFNKDLRFCIYLWLSYRYLSVFLRIHSLNNRIYSIMIIVIKYKVATYAFRLFWVNSIFSRDYLDIFHIIRYRLRFAWLIHEVINKWATLWLIIVIDLLCLNIVDMLRNKSIEFVRNIFNRSFDIDLVLFIVEFRKGFIVIEFVFKIEGFFIIEPEIISIEVIIIILYAAFHVLLKCFLRGIIWLIVCRTLIACVIFHVLIGSNLADWDHRIVVKDITWTRINLHCLLVILAWVVRRWHHELLVILVSFWLCFI